MNTECLRIANEMKSTLEGDAWYGNSVRVLLKGVTSQQAVKRPIASAHSIWELVLHIKVWAQAALNTVNGMPMPKFPMPSEQDFPAIQGNTEQAWQSAVEGMFDAYRKLTAAVGQLQDDRLEQTVPGRSYNYYQLLHGMTQHAIYHGGQIALLKKM
jgi:hypothetical protein